MRIAETRAAYSSVKVSAASLMMRLVPRQVSRASGNPPLQFVESLERRQLLSTTGVIAHSKPPATPPQYDHVVIVVEENHSYSKI
ncbi:MAG: hypothetical protein JWO87_3706, partial [Phycisphaerales bacterium]|nr:hypothetical protein [Phycisphaerales bacterium]